MKAPWRVAAAALALAAIVCLTAQAQVREGNRFPTLKAHDLKGKAIDTSKLRGSVVLVDLWATWCGPCRASIPHVQALHRKYSARGLRVVGISIGEGRDRPSQYARAAGMTYTVGWTSAPEAQAILRKVGTSGIPAMFVVDRKGVLRWVQEGFSPESAAAMEKLVAKLVSQKA